MSTPADTNAVPPEYEENALLRQWLSLWLWLVVPWVVTIGAALLFHPFFVMGPVRVIGFFSVLVPGWALTRALAGWAWPTKSLDRWLAALSVAGVWAGWLASLVELGKL